jgi:hypothetical protein
VVVLPALASLAVAVAGSLPFLSRARFLEFDVLGLAPPFCELNDFACYLQESMFVRTAIGLMLAGTVYGMVSQHQTGRGLRRFAAVVGGISYIAGALIVQAIAGDNPMTGIINGAIDAAGVTRDMLPAWSEVVRELAWPTGAVALVVTRPSRSRRGLAGHSLPQRSPGSPR